MNGISLLSGLFFTAFIAATVFPMQSEAVLAGLLLKTAYAPVLLVSIASVGNVLGSCVNWWLGRSAEKFKDRKWFPVSEHSLVKAQQRYHRYGKWSLLLSWVPFVGDPITVMAGVMKEKFYIFLSLVFIAKAARYIAIGVSVTHLSG